MNLTRTLAPLVMVGGAGLLALSGGAAGTPAASGARVNSAPAKGRMLPAPAGLSAHAVSATKKLKSFNWSGYAQSTPAERTFTAVKDFWTVPKVNTSKAGDQYSSDWVGIGGFKDSTLVQDGTEADNIGGTAQYDAWTEILPAAEVVIPGLTISPGNKIESIVQETKANTWKMTVMDLTTGKSGGRTVAYTSSGLSVEAIHERPCIKDDCQTVSDLATLATTPPVTFDPGSYSTTAPSSAPVYAPLLVVATGATLNDIRMIDNAGTAIIATPSAPDSDHDGFTVADGSTAPPPPSS